MSRLIFW